MLQRDCPCGSGTPYDACCGALHRGTRLAATPLQLMRARYAAYAVGDADFVFTSWHPRTRPASVTLDDDLVWTSLEIHGDGLLDERNGWVEFTARYLARTGAGRLHERSRFERRAGRWLYLDGDIG